MVGFVVFVSSCRDMASQHGKKGGAQRNNNNVQYVDNNVFFELRKHIALHQIHKIMLFLATSYDPFKHYSSTENV